MKQLFGKIPFLRLTLALAAGIILASLILFPPVIALYSLFLILGVLVVLQRVYIFRLSGWFGTVVLLFFIFLGIAVYSLYNKKPVLFENGNYSAIVLEAPVEKPNSYKSILKINAVIQHDTLISTQEKILAYFSRNEDAARLQPGDVLLLKESPQIIENNGNPFEFDYKNYLARDKIYRQVYLADGKWQKTSIRSSFSLKILAEKTRMKLLEIYHSQNFSKNEMDILSALTLGYKREIDPETRQVFSSAGAMHILAVSGLHVGIVFLILRFVFGFLRRSSAGKIFFIAISISVLWTFALLTGLSPSVSRAATMFTFVVIGSNLNRQTNIYNTLAGSALFLLLVNPNNLFDVGFQLSYTAVFGIVLLQPKLNKLFSPSNKVLLFFWQLLTVSIAAQIATLPITLYYFNQFPAYFWISNLFVIPAAFALIPLGFTLLLFHNIPLLSTALTAVTGFIIQMLYTLLQFIERLPFSVWDIFISPAELLFILGILISLLIFIEFHRKAAIKSLLFFTLLLMTASFYSKISTLLGKQLIIYNSNENTIIHLISGKQNYVVSEKPLEENNYSLITIENTIEALRLEKPNMLSAKKSFTDDKLFIENGMLFFEGKTILIKPDLSVNLESVNPDIVVNPLNTKKIKQEDDLNYWIVTNSRNISDELYSSSLIHNLRENRAFTKEW